MFNYANVKSSRYQAAVPDCWRLLQLFRTIPNHSDFRMLLYDSDDSQKCGMKKYATPYDKSAYSEWIDPRIL